MEAIGIIYTQFSKKEDCPIQPLFSTKCSATVKIHDEYSEALKDIESFSHIFLIYQFNKASEIKLIRSTFLDDTPRGLFATRHPCRPNNIGLSIVKLLKIEGSSLIIEGADMLDGTPLLDIKPYIPKYDSIPAASGGWTSDINWRPKPQGRE